MKPFLNHYLLLFPVLLIAGSFHNAVPPTISVTPTSLTFSAQGGTQQIVVDATVSWRLTEIPNWCSVDKKLGDAGKTTVTVTASPSARSAVQTGRLTFSPKTGMNVFCNVQQNFIQLDISNALRYVENGGEQYFTITTTENWSISDYPSWLQFSILSGKPGKTMVRVQAASNSEQNARSKTFKITAGLRSVLNSVDQRAKSLYGSAPDISISPNLNFTSTAGTDYLNGYASECTWTAKDYPSWITVPNPYGGGSNVVEVQVSANTSTSSRSGTIKFVATGFHFESTRYITVKQDGKK